MVEIEIELSVTQSEIESKIDSLCTHVIKVNNRILCVPERGKLVEVVLLLMRNQIPYQLKSSPS